MVGMMNRWRTTLGRLTGSMFSALAVCLGIAVVNPASAATEPVNTPDIDVPIVQGETACCESNENMQLVVSNLLQNLADAFKQRDVTAVHMSLDRNSTYYNSLRMQFDDLLARYTDISFTFRVVETQAHTGGSTAGESMVAATVEVTFDAILVTTGMRVHEQSNDLFELVKTGDRKLVIYSWHSDKYMQF